MYSVSAGFKTNVKAIVRQVFGKVKVDYTDPFLDQTIDVSATEEANVSYPLQAANALTAPSVKIASLDGTWLLDGTYGLAPDADEAFNHEMGWWGSQLAGVGGAFTLPYPKLTASFGSRPIWALKVVGDSKRGEYPVDFTVKLYSTGDVLEHTETVTGNTLVSWSSDIPDVVGIVKSELEITKWSHAGRQAKIVEFFTSISETYEGEDVVQIRLLEESEIGSGSLPIGNISANEIMVTLSNESRKFDEGNTSSPLYQLIKANRRVRAWLGVEVAGAVEYVPLGVFWTRDWDVPEDGITATTVGLDRLELLRKSNYVVSTVQQNVTMYDLAVDILEDAGLTSSEYWIDTELQSYTVGYAYFEPTSHREALRMVAEATLSQVYMDRDGILRIEGANYLAGQTSVDSLTMEDYFTKNNPSKSSEVSNYVEVETQPLVAGSPEAVFAANENLTVPANSTLEVNVYYNKVPCISALASVSGSAYVTISSATYYAWGANLVLLNSNGANQSVSLSVTATPLELKNKVVAVAQDTQSILQNGKLKYTFPNNPLIQSLTLAQTIADTLVASFKNPRRDTDMRWRGNPALLLSDVITVADRNEQNTYYITRQELDFKGYLSANLIGRRSN